LSDNALHVDANQGDDLQLLIQRNSPRVQMHVSKTTVLTWPDSRLSFIHTYFQIRIKIRYKKTHSCIWGKCRRLVH